MPDLFNDWTRDHAGNFVDWIKPPYYVNGHLNLLLPHEIEISYEQLTKRNGEYLQLTYRKMGFRNKDAQGPEIPRASLEHK